MKKYIKISGALFGLLVIAILFYPQLVQNSWLVYTANGIASDFPQLDQIPILLELPPDDIESNKNRTEITYEGYKFQIPWQGKIEESGNILILKSPNGSILFTPPSKSSNLLATITEQKPEDYKKLIHMLGEDSVESNYSLCIKALSTLPSNISVLSSTEELVVNIILLLYKGTLVSTTAETGLYYFKTKDSYGFQFGTPSKSERIMLSLFNNNDQTFELLIANKNNQITQDDINNILKSFKKSS